MTSAELLEQTCKWYGGCAMSVLEIENYPKSYKIDGFGMLREWIKKTQSITVGLLRLAAIEGKGDHVKHGPN